MHRAKYPAHRDKAVMNGVRGDVVDAVFMSLLRGGEWGLARRRHFA
jgi:hypothetical protein